MRKCAKIRMGQFCESPQRPLGDGYGPTYISADLFPNPPNGRWGMVKVQPPIVQCFAVGGRLGFNHPPTAVGGIQEKIACWCRLGFNHPPTAVGGIRPKLFSLMLAHMRIRRLDWTV